MENNNGTCGGHCKCSCLCHKTMGFLAVLLGLAFLGSTWWGWPSTESLSIIWPVLVIIAGLKSVFADKCKCC